MANALVTLSDKVTSEIQDLIRLNIDSAEGFTAAADLIEDKSLASQFREYAAQRSANAEELKATVAYNGEEPAQSGTTSGTLHRWWLELKGKVTSGSSHQVLSEAERGEDSIKQRYERAIKECAGSPVSDLLTRQYSGVKATHDRIRDLREKKKDEDFARGRKNKKN